MLPLVGTLQWLVSLCREWPIAQQQRKLRKSLWEVPLRKAAERKWMKETWGVLWSSPQRILVLGHVTLLKPTTEKQLLRHSEVTES